VSLDVDVKAQVGQLVDEALRTRLGIEAVELVLAELMRGLAAGNDVVDDHQERMGERYRRFLGAPPRSNAPVARRERGVLGVCCGLRRLNQQRT
jgi:hypothetical protein